MRPFNHKIVLITKRHEPQRLTSDFTRRVVSAVVSLPISEVDLPMKLEARGVEPLSSSLSTQTSTRLSGDKF